MRENTVKENSCSLEEYYIFATYITFTLALTFGNLRTSVRAYLHHDALDVCLQEGLLHVIKEAGQILLTVLHHQEDAVKTRHWPRPHSSFTQSHRHVCCTDYTSLHPHSYSSYISVRTVRYIKCSICQPNECSFNSGHLRHKLLITL